MATFKAEVQNKRADGTYNVRIRLTHNGAVRRISTNVFVVQADVTKGKKIKNARILKRCDELIARCRDACGALGFAVSSMPIDVLAERLKEKLKGEEKFYLDVIEYAKKIVKTMNAGTARNYTTALNALRRYTKRDSIDVSEINKAFLSGFKRFLETEGSMRGSNRKSKHAIESAKGGRAVSLYLSCLRAIHNRAKEEYNDEDRDLLRIPYSPFKHFPVKAAGAPSKRALSVETIQAVMDLPYANETHVNKQNRFNLAKDCFILSFALVGMNSADLYSCETLNRDTLIYNRQKTKTRRSDNAEMQVLIDKRVASLVAKYKDETRGRVFDFHRRYANTGTFNRALNRGLKRIGALVGVNDLEFYAARHSWATIARTKVGIDKATVHEALNHVDEKMKVTDIYLAKDYSLVHAANEKVLDLFNFKFYAEVDIQKNKNGS